MLVLVILKVEKMRPFFILFNSWQFWIFSPRDQITGKANWPTLALGGPPARLRGMHRRHRCAAQAVAGGAAWQSGARPRVGDYGGRGCRHMTKTPQHKSPSISETKKPGRQAENRVALGAFSRLHRLQSWFGLCVDSRQLD